MNVNKLEFLDQYAVDGQHYHRQQEITNLISKPASADTADWNTYRFLNKSGELTKDENLPAMMKSDNMYIRAKSINHPLTTSDDIDNILNHPNGKKIHLDALNSDKLSQASIDKIVHTDSDAHNKVDAVNHPNNTKTIDHLNAIMHIPGVASAFAVHNGSSSHTLLHLYKNNVFSHDDIMSVVGHKNCTDEIHNAVYEKNGPAHATTLRSLLNAKSPEFFDKVMSDINKTGVTSLIHLAHNKLLYNTHTPTHHLVNAMENPHISNADKRFGQMTLMQRGHYDKDLGISESLNTVEPKETIPEDSMVHQMGLMSAAMIGGTNFSIHKIGDLGHLVQFDKDGATEVHHLDPMLSGGHLVGSATPSMRMISTFKNHIQGLLDDGKTVRISTHKNMAKGFRSITQRLIDKNPEYKMSEPTDTTHELTGDELTQWELKK